MRIPLILLSLGLVSASFASSQTPAPVAPLPRPTVPATPAAPVTPAGQAAPRPAPATARPQPVSSRGGMAITVTDTGGSTRTGIDVEIVGSTDRTGKTSSSGQINFPGLLAGTYRLRFSGESVITFEREAVVRGGQVLDIDVALNKADPPKVVVVTPPPPPPPAQAPAPATASSGPTGQPQNLSIPALLEKEFVGRQPQRESLLSCSRETRTTMLQLNEPSPDRTFADADSIYYVMGGEGTATINGRDSRITTNGFLSVPRGTQHSFARRGNRPLVLLVVQGGEPCSEAR